ncbi:DUF3712 domain-containing protein [Aspergillus mulundensis]|uniref:Uncharacterized protein n=1 Tax=Aspergillus mulundensis TaxID=1810919 RepID=A0A3D8T700_9EURO|nr:Uncharacterized protein DSM5745_01110 [Aspergillus mulundensis]RDW93788.1 Uncharacterized protein DSM5745_01110 [Aspergillus mulundensis]
MSSAGSPVEKPAKAASKHTLGSLRGPLAGSDADIESIEKTPGDVSLVEPKLKQKKTRRVKRHFARFWCCYVFWSVIFLAIFLPIFFLVVIPAIAQLVLDNGTLLLVNATILEPRPDSILLTLEAALDLPISLPVRIDPFLLSIYNQDVEGNNTIFSSELAGTVIDGNTTLGVESVHTPVDVKLWTDYVHKVVFTPHAPLPVKGETNAYLGKLKSHVKLDKNIHQNTLNQFPGFSIEDPSLVFNETDYNLVAKATLPNLSVMTLQIGTTVLDLKAGNYTLGNATIDDLILYPGNHSSPVTGILDLDYLVSNLHGILETQGDALSRGFLRLDAVGRSATYDGELVPYYTEALQQLTLTAEVALAGLVLNTVEGVIRPNGTNIFHNLTDPNGPTSIHDIINSIDDPDGSLGLNKTRPNS